MSLPASANNLPDLLYHSDCELKEAVCRLIEQQEGKRVLLLFDGYDELSNAQLGEISFLQQLLRNPCLLRGATIMVTSRLFSLERHIEIVAEVKRTSALLVKTNQLHCWMTSTCMCPLVRSSIA